jgi:hypothetical protein
MQFKIPFATHPCVGNMRVLVVKYPFERRPKPYNNNLTSYNIVLPLSQQQVHIVLYLRSNDDDDDYVYLLHN